MRVLIVLLLLLSPAFAGRRCQTCLRDTHGHIRRSQAVKREFRANHPCPSTGRTSGACPGYTIDHSVALCKGGLDIPSNLSYQTTAEAKAKDKIECK